MWCDNADQRGALSVSPHFEGRKSANFSAIFRRLEQFKPYNFEIAQDIADLKQRPETTCIMEYLCQI